MSNKEQNLSEFKKRILFGLRLAGERLLEEKKRTGSKLVTMLDDKVVELTADEYLKLKKEGRF